jgi:CRP/FNR family transcriptional regulator, anaerobic regulatory protein
MTDTVFNELKIFIEPELKAEIIKHGKVIQAQSGDVLIREGQHLNFLPIVIRGRIRVYQEKDDREILLYYVGPEETCMMSLSAAYLDYSSAANGMAIEPTEILVLPAYLIADWQLKYPSWNRYIIRTFKDRYNELLNAFGNVAFKPISSRVKEYLLQKSHLIETKKIPVSHQTLANELGTTRVVVSRILKQFEKDNVLKLHRGHIEIL